MRKVSQGRHLESMAYLLRRTQLGILCVSLAAGCGEDHGEAPKPNLEPKGTQAASFVGGTRLKAVMAEAKDGTSVFLHWRDTALGLPCRYEAFDDGMRCLPLEGVATIYGEALANDFADPQCTQRLIAKARRSAKSDLVQLVGGCWTTQTYFRVSAPYTETVTYQNTAAGCEARTRLGDADLLTLEPVGFDNFVLATVLAGAPSGDIAPTFLLGADGSRAPHGFRDVRGVDCWPRQTEQGVRCMPLDFARSDRSDAYADAECSLIAAAPEKFCERRSSLPFVVSATFGDSINGVHRGGPRLSEAFRRTGSTDCHRAGEKAILFGVGEPVPLADFLPATLSQLTRESGLSQSVAQVNGLTLGLFTQPRATTFGGFDCTLAAGRDGIPRCMPPTGYTQQDFSEPTCTEPVWQTGWKLVSIGVGGPLQESLRAGLHDVELELVERVLGGGVPYEGKVFSRRGSTCEVRTDVPTTKQPYMRFSTEVPLDKFTAFSIIER